MAFMLNLDCNEGDVLSTVQKIMSKDFLKRFGPDIYESRIFDDFYEMEIRLPCYRAFSTFWNLSCGLRP